MLKIGLTGGVGSGKSTVAALFADKGVPVIDADVVARELVEPGQAALAEIVEAFGYAVLADGRLDRAALRTRIYSDPNAKKILEGILHPKVYQMMHDQTEALRQPYCIFAIPLLLETNRRDFVDRVLVVDCPGALQYERVSRRDGLDIPAIARIIAAQISREDRLAAADDVIDNAGAPDMLRERVEALHQAYLSLARQQAKASPSARGY
ncbi:MAG: dephospho-CoA kinase [Candidatus Methylumidiphilus sp.]